MLLKEAFEKHIGIILNETAGLFDGATDIVNRILSKIDIESYNGKEEIFTFDESIFNGIDTFFDHASIFIRVIEGDDNKGKGGYRSQWSNFNKKTKHIDTIYLEFNLTLMRYNNVNFFKPLFYYELTHAYEDYNRMLRGSQRLYVYNKEKKYYNNQQQNVTTNSLILAKEIIYFLHGPERRAYISMIKGILETNNIKYHSPKQIKELVFKSRLWEKYENIENNIKCLSDITITAEQNKIVSYFNNNGYKVKNYTQLINSLDKIFSNFKERFSKTLAKQIAIYQQELNQNMEEY